VNQHVNPAFHYSAAQIDTMLSNVNKRRSEFAPLFPWDDANFGLDEEWARFYPYRQKVKPGDHLELKVVIVNHSPAKREFVVTPHAPMGWHVDAGPYHLSISSRKTGELSIPLTAGAAGLGIVTADISFDKWEFREWMESLIDVR